MGEAVDAVIRGRLKADRSYGFSFSGGLDSRLLGGFLAQQGIRPQAMTFGNPSDIEMRCAQNVVRALKWPHRQVPIDESAYPRYAGQELDSRHLANGFSCLMLWQDIPGAETCRDGQLTGYAMDSILGADNLCNAHGPQTLVNFDNSFKTFNRWGIDPSVLQNLLTLKGASEAIAWAMDRLRQMYHSTPGEEFQKAWRFGLNNRTRFHTSAAIGLHTTWPWPQIPYMDTSIFEIMGSLPFASMNGRRIQYTLLTTRYPDLARLPLDRNQFNIQPLLTRYHPTLDRILYSGIERAYRWEHRLRGLRGERRYYYRLIDFNNPGWKRVRRQAEPFRDHLHAIMDCKRLNQLWPAPDIALECRDAIIDSSKAKLLTGLALWASRYL